MKPGLVPGSPSNGRHQRLPTTTASPLSLMSGPSASCLQKLSHMDVYPIQVRTPNVVFI